MTVLRSDAARSRARILEAARGLDLADLRLNDVARRAGVGVGTVYRRFPTVEALVAALAEGALRRLREATAAALAEPDPGRAVEQLLREALALQLDDAGLQTALLADDPLAPELAALRAEALAEAEAVLERARAAGAVRPDLTAATLQRLVCGIEHAIRIGDGADRALCTEVLLAGVLVESRPTDATGPQVKNRSRCGAEMVESHAHEDAPGE
ncbi:TetR/AcrR family transcriptional regulator [Brachybacterium sp. DNPG3]